jgi:Mg-chelatase subunit ChlD
VRRLAFAVAALGLTACAAPKPARPPEPALVAVEILRGVVPAPESAGRVAIVIDASVSMRAPAAAGVSRLAAAQARASEVLETLPPGARVSVDAAGGAKGAACAAPLRVAPPSTDTGAAAEALRQLAPAGEGSLAEALQTVTRSLTAEGAADGARVLALGDLEDGCGVDLCAAVSALVASGASLDLVLLGERPTPSCVVAAEPGPSVPPGLAEPASAVRFEVLPAAGAAVTGVSGASPVRAPAGPARIEVGLDPPLEIGPLTLAAGALVRVRVLDFPAASPPVREWSLEVLGAGADLAASPAPASPASP